MRLSVGDRVRVKGASRTAGVAHIDNNGMVRIVYDDNPKDWTWITTSRLELVETKPPADVKGALRALLAYCVSARRYQVLNPYLVPEIANAIRAYEKETGKAFDLEEV